MLLKTVLMFSLLIFSAGCSVEEANPEPTNETQAQPVAPELVKKTVKLFKKSDVSYKVLPLEEPNSYALEVSWPETDYFVFLRQSTNPEFMKIAKDKQSHRLIVAGGKKAIIEIEARESETASVSEHLKLEVEVPRDWVINNIYQLSGNQTQKCGRLFFNKNAVLELKNFNIEVQCEELISNDGVIRTFPGDAVASGKGANGRSGGTAKLSFKTARGHIRLSLHGENGAGGRHGFKGFMVGRGRAYSACKGQDGGEGGASGSAYIFVEQPTKLKVETVITLGKGGNGGEMIAELNDMEAIMPNRPGETCDLAGGSGEPGLPGEIGEACFQVSNNQPVCERNFTENAPAIVTF